MCTDVALEYVSTIWVRMMCSTDTLVCVILHPMKLMAEKCFHKKRCLLFSKLECHYELNEIYCSRQ